MDFGFNDEKFKGESTVVPYAQFINPVRCSYFGVAIRESCVEAAGFIPTSSWMEVNHSFKGAKQPEKLLLCTNPRLVILHRSKPYMSNGSEVTLFDAGRRNKEHGWKAFSYAVVLFLDENNEPLSELPFRLKCSGHAGMSFIKSYQYYQNTDSFVNKFISVYQELTGDKEPKNDMFFAHAVYQPYFVEGEATASNGESSSCCLTSSFKVPNSENFTEFIIPWIKDGERNPESEKIIQMQKQSKSWIEIKTVMQEYAEYSEDEPGSQMVSVNKVQGETAFNRESWIDSIKQWAESYEMSLFELKDFIQSRYNKTHSSQLSPQELMDFHEFLKNYEPNQVMADEF